VSSAGTGSKSDKDSRALRLAAAPDGSDASEPICRSSAPPSSSRARTSSRNDIRDNPELFRALAREQDRVCALIARRRAVERASARGALITIAPR
jgi:hypothetical protein